MAKSKPVVSSTSLSIESVIFRPKNAFVKPSWYLEILKDGFSFCRRGLSNALPRKDSLSSTWRPASLNPVLLISVTAFNVLVITVLGILQWISNRDGGLYFAEKADDIPAAVTFLHLHFPTLIAVVYSVVWSWIDLDVKRLEPWFQMSQASGAEARDSVLLHYPVDFIASVPINAAKRRQWAVVFVSTITVAIFWAVTPLQSAIFSVDTISRTRLVPVTVSDSLIPLEQQANKLNTGFLNDGYSVLWLGQDLPPFTTKDFALAPLKLPEYQPVTGLNKTITYPTKRYETSLNCYPPASMKTTQDTEITADNGRGCVAEKVVDWYERSMAIPFRAYYIGYFDDPHASYSLAMGGCPKNASNTFLAIWRHASLYPPNFDDPANATALFCEASYFSQSVDATITSPGHSVVGINPTGPREIISDADFKLERFHYILGTGSTPLMAETANQQQDATDRREVTDSTVLYQNARLNNMSVEVPTSNMVGFPIGSSKLAPEQYLNASKLGSSFEAAHKLLFALAAQDMMTQPEDNGPQFIGEERYTVQAVTLVQTFTFLVQGFLVFIIILTLFLLYVSWKRAISLPSDPNSISEVMSLSTSTDLLEAFKSFDSLGSHGLADKLGGTKFQLLPADIGLRKRGLQIQKGATADSTPNNVVSTDTPSNQTHAKGPPVQPTQLRAPIGIVFILFLMRSLAAIIFLKQKIEKNNGLPLPSRNPIVEQLVTNYLPTALATFMEPWWIVLNRFTCLIQPFKDLYRGSSPARKSLSTKYTSLPPQLIFWRAMKAGHFLLVIISFTGLLSNLLTVSLSGLFVQKTITSDKPTSFRQLFQPSFPEGFNSTDFTSLDSEYEKYEHYHVAMSNISTNTSLPPWVGPEFYFLPVELPTSIDDVDGNDDDKASVQYQLPTIGIGAELDCLELSEKDSDHRYEFNLTRGAVEATFATIHRNKDRDLLRCRGFPDSYSGIRHTRTVMGKTDGRRALEIWPPMTVSPEDENKPNSEFCADSVVGGWIRANLTEHSGKPLRNENKNVSINSMEKMFLSCQPRLKSAQFEVRVDTTGRIIDWTQIGSFDDSLRGDVSYIASLASYYIRPSTPTWHNDSLASDWTNYLIKLKTKSNDILDPTSPVPEFNSTAEVFSELYSQLFAILFSLKSDNLTSADRGVPGIAGYQKTQQPRLFFSESMFIISVAIYAIDILVAVAIYVGFRRAFLPRLPTTIASYIASFAASHIPELLSDNPEPTVEKRMDDLDRQGYRYGLGEFLGTDGKTHFGIDRVPFIGMKREEPGGGRATGVDEYI